MTETTRPNILFICTDQWRGDCLSIAGHPVVETPHLDLIAEQGVIFTQAYSACPSCIAARASIFTGLTPRRHGFVGYRDGVNWEYKTTLAGTLASAGYHTQCVGKMHVYPCRNLMGFHNVILHDGYLHFARREQRDLGQIDDYIPWLREKLSSAYADYVDACMGCNGYVVHPWIYDEMLHPTSWVTTQGIDFLRRRDPTKPFFLMLSYHRPHPPLDPPKYYLDLYNHKELPPIPIGDWADFELPAGRGIDSPVPHDKKMVDLARRAYYAQITNIDHQINRMMMALLDYGLFENTAILFTSDHGDMLYDHNLVAKSVPFDGSARVPFILRLPASYSSQTYKRGQRISAVIELRDIFPTFCEIAQTDVPSSVEGRSLLSLCRGENIWREYIHGEHTAGNISNHWITDGREKYIWFSQTGREMLFNITEDPQELHDLSKKYPDRLAFWREKLILELADREEGFVKDGKLIVGRPQSPTLKHTGRGI